MQKINSFLILLISFSVNSYALEKVYFGDGVKDIFVNSHESTLLLFQSPPIAKVCQPNGVIELFPIESKDEVDTMTLSQGADLMGMMKEKSSSQQIELMLKLTPYRENQITSCDIKLVSGETVSVKFKPISTLRRPLIEFENIFSKSSQSKMNSSSSDSLEVFQQFSTGGELLSFIDLTPLTSNKTARSELARYEILYLGTDREKYKAWIFKVISAKPAKDLPLLKNIKVNEIFYSLWAKDTPLKPMSQLEIGQEVKLFILSSSDITPEEMMRKLP